MQNLKFLTCLYAWVHSAIFGTYFSAKGRGCKIYFAEGAKRSFRKYYSLLGLGNNSEDRSEGET